MGNVFWTWLWVIGISDRSSPRLLSVECDHSFQSLLLSLLAPTESMANMLGFTGHVGNAEALMPYGSRVESNTKPMTATRNANHRAKQAALMCCYRSPLKKRTQTSPANCMPWLSSQQQLTFVMESVCVAFDWMCIRRTYFHNYHQGQWLTQWVESQLVAICRRCK